MTDAAIAAVLEAYRAAVRAKDVAAFVALYDPGVRVFDAWNAWSYDGIAAWRAMAAGWFGSLGAETVDVGWEAVRAEAAGDLAVLDAIVTYRGSGAAGQPPHAVANRLSWALRRRGEGWAIIHEHTSVPVDGATAKAVFTR